MITIEAEPAPVQIDPDRTAVVIIDMQRDFLEPGSFGDSLGNKSASLRAQWRRARRCRQGRPARSAGDPYARGPPARSVGCTAGQDRPRRPVEAHWRCRPDGPHPRARRAGHDIVPELYPQAGEPVIDKPGKGAFYATDLHAILGITPSTP